MIDEADPNTPRWHLRFANFKAALATLREGIDLLSKRPLSSLERDGLIQRFEYTWEQSWKVMLDYLGATGIKVAVINPANVNRAAFQAGLISDGDAWVKARKDRNIVSHEYGIDQAMRVANDIVSVYMALFDELEERLENERLIGN